MNCVTESKQSKETPTDIKHCIMFAGRGKGKGKVRETNRFIHIFFTFCYVKYNLIRISYYYALEIVLTITHGNRKKENYRRQTTNNLVNNILIYIYI